MLGLEREYLTGSVVNPLCFVAFSKMNYLHVQCHLPCEMPRFTHAGNYQYIKDTDVHAARA